MKKYYLRLKHYFQKHDLGYYSHEGDLKFRCRSCGLLMDLDPDKIDFKLWGERK